MTTEQANQPAITIYTMPNCMQCRATFRWLDKREIIYTAVDISQDDTAADYVQQLGYKQAPVTVTSDGEHWSGFQPEKLEAAL